MGDYWLSESFRQEQARILSERNQLNHTEDNDKLQDLKKQWLSLLENEMYPIVREIRYLEKVEEHTKQGTMLVLYAKEGKVNQCEQLLKEGVKPDVRKSAFEGAMRNAHIDVIILLNRYGYLITTNEGQSLLVLAAANNSKECVDLILKNPKIDINQVCYDGIHAGYFPALTVAVQKGHHDMVEYLIQKGADVNQGGGYNDLPLEYAQDQKMVEILERHGAKSNEAD